MDYENLTEEHYDLNKGPINSSFSQRYNLTDLVKLPQAFIAAHLERISGIKVIWTSILADHLLLKDDDTKLMLFHQVSILELHKMPPTTLLPKVLVDETIRSIPLLIPPVLGKPNPWFQQRRKKNLIDAQAGVCDRLNSSERQIEKFVYWRDRLVVLKGTFDDADPRNISQLWWDDQRKTQWFCRAGLHYDRVLRRSAVRGGDCASLGIGAESEGAESAELGPIVRPRQCERQHLSSQIHHRRDPTVLPGSVNAQCVHIASSAEDSIHWTPCRHSVFNWLWSGRLSSDKGLMALILVAIHAETLASTSRS